MPRVLRTAQAHQDLLEIWEFVARRSIERADRLTEAIEQKCILVAQFPEMGRRRDELAPGVRSTLVERYMILYRIADDGIEVLRVVHGSRDLPRLFGE
jgi:toxin ParE1/3/4